MESLIILILALSFLQLVVQISLTEKSWQKWLLISIMGIFSIATYPLAIEQSYTSIVELISNPKVLIDFSVIQISEAILGILLSVILLKKAIGEKTNLWLVQLRFIPGIICFPAIFYGQSFLFMHIPNQNFMRLAILIAIGLAALLALLTWGLKWLINELELRCEVKIFLHAAQVVLASVLYLLTAGIPVSTLPDNSSLQQFLVLFAGVFVFSVAGYLLYHIKMKRLNKLKNK